MRLQACVLFFLRLDSSPDDPESRLSRRVTLTGKTKSTGSLSYRKLSDDPGLVDNVDVHSYKKISSRTLKGTLVCTR